MRLGDPISSTEVPPTLWVVWLYPRGTQPGKWWLLGWSWVLNLEVSLSQHSAEWLETTCGAVPVRRDFFFSVHFTLFSTAFLPSFKFKVVRGCDSFKDVIRKMKSKAKPPNLWSGRDVFIPLTKVFFQRAAEFVWKCSHAGIGLFTSVVRNAGLHLCVTTFIKY